MLIPFIADGQFYHNLKSIIEHIPLKSCCIHKSRSFTEITESRIWLDIPFHETLCSFYNSNHIEDKTHFVLQFNVSFIQRIFRSEI